MILILGILAGIIIGLLIAIIVLISVKKYQVIENKLKKFIGVNQAKIIDTGNELDSLVEQLKQEQENEK